MQHRLFEIQILVFQFLNQLQFQNTKYSSPTDEHVLPMAKISLLFQQFEEIDDVLDHI